MFDYELTSRASMESETRRIALGLRQGDVLVLEALVEQYQYRLVRYLIYLLGRRGGVDDLVQEIWLRVLERGYAIATDAAGNVLRDAAQVVLGDAVNVQLHRGRLIADVKRTETGNKR